MGAQTSRTYPTIGDRIRFYSTDYGEILLLRLRCGLASFRRPIRTMLRVTFTHAPWTVDFRDGTRVTLQEKTALFNAGREYLFRNARYAWTNPDTGATVRLHGPENAVLAKEEWRWLPVKGRTVVDIGANVGDSALYFASRGARDVLAIEPYPQVLAQARANLELNPELRGIVLVNAGVGRERRLTIDPRRATTEGSDLAVSRGPGVEVEVMGLDTLVSRWDIHDAVLKMDTEGSEYETFEDANREAMRRFTHIQVEYHYGPERLLSVLERAGFQCDATQPRYFFNPASASNPHMFIGFVQATRVG